MSKTACNWSSDFHIPSMSTLFLFFFIIYDGILLHVP
jgi:hypothetical protein